jgi:hypothetical protein
MSFAKSPTGRLKVKTRGNQGTEKKVRVIPHNHENKHPGELGPAAGTHTLANYRMKRERERGYKNTPKKPKKVRPDAYTSNLESPNSQFSFASPSEASFASPSGASFASPSGATDESPSGASFTSPSGASPPIKKKRGNTGGRRKTKRRKSLFLKKRTKKRTKRRKRRKTKRRGRKSSRRR